MISTTMEQTKHITQSGTTNNFHYKGMASPTNRPTLLICTSDSYTYVLIATDETPSFHHILESEIAQNS